MPPTAKKRLSGLTRPVRLMASKGWSIQAISRLYSITGEDVKRIVAPQPPKVRALARKKKEASPESLDRAVWRGPKEDDRYRDAECLRGAPLDLKLEFLHSPVHIPAIGPPPSSSARAAWDDLTVKGERHGRSRVSDSQVLLIRRLHFEGLGSFTLANRFGIHPRTVQAIIRRETWKHI